MKENHTRSYRSLTVWQRAMELVVSIYQLTQEFPVDERYGLTSQMRRSAISIVSNIAEGRYRGTRKDNLQFLRVAFSSGAELETQVEVAKRLPLTRDLDFSSVESLLEEVMKMLNALTSSEKSH